MITARLSYCRVSEGKENKNLRLVSSKEPLFTIPSYNPELPLEIERQELVYYDAGTWRVIGLLSSGEWHIRRVDSGKRGDDFQIGDKRVSKSQIVRCGKF